MKTKSILLAGIVLILLAGAIIFYASYWKPNQDAYELITEAKMISERGDKNSINNAIDILTKAIVKYPESKYASEAYFQIARCYENLGLLRLAYLKYVYLAKSNSVNNDIKKEILIRLAHINVLKQYSEEAIDQLLSLLQTNFNKESRSRIYSELGYTYLKLRDFQKAKRMFEIALTEYGSNEEAILGQARTLKWMGRDNEAFDIYENFLKYYGAISPYADDVRTALREQAYSSGINAYRKGQYTNAISYFNKILRLFNWHRKSENALYWTGESYYSMGQYDKAIDYFNRTLSNGFYHKDEDARIKKGYCYFSSKKFDLAAREFQIYLQQYSNGRYVSVAREWKDMSTKELLFRIETQKLPETKKTPAIIKEEKPEEDVLDEEPEDDGLEEEAISEDEEIAGDYDDYMFNNKNIKFENVAEL